MLHLVFASLSKSLTTQPQLVSKHSKIRQIELLVTTVHFAQKFIALLVFDMGLGEQVELHNYLFLFLTEKA